MRNKIEDYIQGQMENFIPMLKIRSILNDCNNNVSELQALLPFELTNDERRQYFHYRLRTEIAKLLIVSVVAYLMRDIFVEVLRSISIPQYFESIVEYINDSTLDRVLTELLGI